MSSFWENNREFVNKQEMKALLPRRRRLSNKGTYGRAAIVAGSKEYTGAAYLALSACLRSGAGYTALFVPKNLLPYYILKAPEGLLAGVCAGDRFVFAEKSMENLLGYDSVAYGMGMGISSDVFKGAAWLIENFSGSLILDADGLNSLSKYGKDSLRNIFANKKSDVILTPHVKEFSRISGMPVAEIVADPVSAAKAFAKNYKVKLLLKDAYSVVTDGETVKINAAGNSGQAKGGSGDVLSGVIAGLCAQGGNTFDSGILGAYLTGKAAELASGETGEYSLLASDVISYLGRSFLELLR